MKRKSQEIFMLLGRILSPLYSLIMNLRALMYHNNFLLHQKKVDATVISVGNIALGGSGKTPLVMYLAQLLQKLKKNTAILSRGYKGTADQSVNIVNDGKTTLLTADEAGDEPLLMAESLNTIPVLTGKKRRDTGEYAIRNFQVNTLLLDDGFQHMAIGRDLDLVLFNGGVITGSDYLEKNWVLPGGYFREPVCALHRADTFIITGVNSQNRDTCSEFKEELLRKFPDKQIFMGMYQVAGFRKYGTRSKKLLSINDQEIANLSFLGFCGIANPVSFEQSLSEININPVKIIPYDDHHRYTEDDLHFLHQMTEKKKAGALLTTEKDLGKLRKLPILKLPIYSLVIDLKMEESFDEYIAESMQN